MTSQALGQCPWTKQMQWSASASLKIKNRLSSSKMMFPRILQCKKCRDPMKLLLHYPISVSLPLLHTKYTPIPPHTLNFPYSLCITNWNDRWSLSTSLPVCTARPSQEASKQTTTWASCTFYYILQKYTQLYLLYSKYLKLKQHFKTHIIFTLIYGCSLLL